MTLTKSLSPTELLDVILLSGLATAVYTSPLLVIESVNAAMLSFWGKDGSVIGLPLEKALPEIVGQPFPELLKQVWHTGITYRATDAKAILRVNGELKTSYFDYTYLAVKDEKGKMKCILNTAVDVTARVLSSGREKSLTHEVGRVTDELLASNKQLIETVWQLSSKNAALKLSEHKLQLLADELDSKVTERTRDLEEMNQELAAINEELHCSNEALNASESQLRVMFNRLAESEKMMETAIAQAGLGTWYVDARTRNFIASPRLFEIFGFGTAEAMSAEAIFDCIRKEYQPKVRAAVDQAIAQKETYHMEYPILTRNLGEMRWVRATGQYYENDVSLPHHFSGTAQDITAQKIAEQQRMNFIGMVSHELKSPLASLSVFLHLLAEKAATSGDEFRQEAVGIGLKQVKKMYGMINEFLEVARTESGALQLNRQRFDLRELVNESIREARALHPAAAFEFDDQPEIIVNGDYNKLGVVLSNLIGNAVKYSPGRKFVGIELMATATDCKVCVRDEGVGIKAEDLPRLFDQYFRVEQGRQLPGFGIGLYLSAGIIRQHEGEIWAESIPGKGSRFFFSLPR